MVNNGHYIHCYKNKYNKFGSYIINTFISAPHASKCWVNWMEQPDALLPVTDILHSIVKNLKNLVALGID